MCGCSALVCVYCSVYWSVYCSVYFSVYYRVYFSVYCSSLPRVGLFAKIVVGSETSVCGHAVGGDLLLTLAFKLHLLAEQDRLSVLSARARFIYTRCIPGNYFHHFAVTLLRV